MALVDFQPAEDRNLMEILNSVAHLSGMGICIYDLNRLLEGYHGPVVRRYHGHKCKFCELIRSIPGVFPHCYESDCDDAVTLAKQYKRPFYHTCHAGLTDIVIPVLCGQQVIAVAFCGQCRLLNETRWEDILPRLQAFNTDIAPLKEAFEELPVTDRITLSAAASLLDMAFQHLTRTMGNELFVSLDIQEDAFSKAITFIEGRFHAGIGVKEVAEHVHLHPSYLARLFTKRLGYGVLHRITLVRIGNAKRLLKSTSIPVKSIASNIGYAHCNYFAKVFRKATGLSPVEYRLAAAREKMEQAKSGVSNM